MTYVQNLMFETYKLDWEYRQFFPMFTLDYFKNLVVQGFLSADGFKEITGEDYEAGNQQA